MSDTTSPSNLFNIPMRANFIQQGQGRPIIMIHGLAASLHDWDDLVPALAQRGYRAYALDILGHGDSPKIDSRAYQMNWLFEHLCGWIDSLGLTQPPVLIGHSLGGYLTLEYARRFPDRAHGLILVDPFFRLSQLPGFLRLTYRRPELNMAVVERTPQWLFRMIVDVTSLSMGHSNGGAHTLPEPIRVQMALDYKRTAPGAYNLLNTMQDLTPYLASIAQPTLLVWGTRDATLSPDSFKDMLSRMPNVTGHAFVAGHVPHQSHAPQFNQLALDFLEELEANVVFPPQSAF